MNTSNARRGLVALYAFARRHSESASRRAIPAEGYRGPTKSRMNTPHTANIDAGSYIYIVLALTDDFRLRAGAAKVYFACYT